ncbi:DUF4189 domain-containing protein [Nocardia sp. R7R-8]|uniref:DUF4189 domain-containing protein n=1 Tax=Nocardia sp. R7R-8 TaxID=3459304 RepID=UPI00403DEF9A
MKFMGKAVGAVAAMGLAVAGSVIGAGAANAAGLYGAIAFSVEDWSYATSIDAPSRAQAIDEALATCSQDGVSDCEILVEWSNGCGALVYTDNAVGTGSGRTPSAALSGAYSSLADYYPPALLAKVGSADKSGTKISEVLCTANAY